MLEPLGVLSGWALEKRGEIEKSRKRDDKKST
jgi:hypothetical protein